MSQTFSFDKIGCTVPHAEAYEAKHINNIAVNICW
uniref:Uncharacterized protein n=1 Tax=viral metagenome TaxID=1070528 RepID=A0A6C0LRR6_9ZZZZ